MPVIAQQPVCFCGHFFKFPAEFYETVLLHHIHLTLQWTNTLHKTTSSCHLLLWYAASHVAKPSTWFSLKYY